jgi:hypothetical protein
MLEKNEIENSRQLLCKIKMQIFFGRVSRSGNCQVNQSRKRINLFWNPAEIFCGSSENGGLLHEEYLTALNNKAS